MVAFAISLFSLLFILVSIELIAFKSKIEAVGGWYFIFTTSLDFLTICGNFSMIVLVGTKVNGFDFNMKFFMAKLDRHLHELSILAKNNRIKVDSNNNILITKVSNNDDKQTIETCANIIEKTNELNE